MDQRISSSRRYGEQDTGFGLIEAKRKGEVVLMKKKCLFLFLLILSLMLSGCGQRGQGSPSERPGTDGSGGEVAQESRGESVPEAEGGVAETPGTEESSVSESTSKDMEGDVAKRG